MQPRFLTTCFSVATSLTTLTFLATQAIAQGPTPRWNGPNAIPVSKGRIEILKQNEITVDVPGTLIVLEPGKRGGVVTKGQIVVKIDDRIAQAELKELDYKANSKVLIDYAKKNVEIETFYLEEMEEAIKKAGSAIYTANELKEQNLKINKAETEVAKAEEDKKVAELQSDTKRVQLEQYTKKAEFDGIVTDVHNKAVGTSIRQGDPIMTIVNFEQMRVVMEVDPRYESRINVGDIVLVKRLRKNAAAPASGSPAPSGRRGFGDRGASTNQKIKTAAPAIQPQAEEAIFVGKVTFTNGLVRSDAAGSLEIEAVVENKVAGIGNYLLKEGVTVEAQIFPAN